MVNKIGALLISSNEPQLEQCLTSINNQTVPFASVVHMDNIIPESVAFNKGLGMSPDKWVMKINGDMILQENAVETALHHMVDNDKVFTYNYILFDSFIKANIYGCSVLLKSAYQLVRYPNMLSNEFYAGKKIQKSGLLKIAPEGVIIGTHCLNPDDFQVFRRFYSFGVKHSKLHMSRRLKILYEETKNIQYRLALEALYLGFSKKHYPSSHNIDFDKQVYNNFIKENGYEDIYRIIT